MYDALAIVFLAALRRANEAVALPVMIIVAEAYARLSHFAGAHGGILETRNDGGTSVITWESALQMFLASKAIFHNGAERRLLVDRLARARRDAGM